MKNLKLLAAMGAIAFYAIFSTAQSTFALTDGDWDFQLLNDEVIITGYRGSATEVIIPDTIYGKPVTGATFDTWSDSENITKAVSIKIPGSIKIIGDFEDCADLKTVTLSEGTEEISQYAFNNCKSLESINLPSTVRVIGQYAFEDCASLSRLDFPEGLQEIQREAFRDSGLKEADLSKTSARIDSGMFYGCKALKRVCLPASITEIPYQLFYDCEALSDIEIPSGVTLINGSAFCGCKSLDSIILPISLKEIRPLAFSRCERLKEAVIPYGTEEIQDSFGQCPALTAVYIPDTVNSLSRYILSGSKNAIVYCTADSYTAKHCEQERISYLADNSVNSDITVLYNGKRISFTKYGQNPEIVNGRTLVPLRPIFEALGADIEWDENTSTVRAKRGYTDVKIQIGAYEMFKNDSSIPFDVPAQLVNDRTMVPVRVIAEAFGADVKWNESGRSVVINE